MKKIKQKYRNYLKKSKTIKKPEKFCHKIFSYIINLFSRKKDS